MRTLFCRRAADDRATQLVAEATSLEDQVPALSTEQDKAAGRMRQLYDDLTHAEKER